MTDKSEWIRNLFASPEEERRTLDPPAAAPATPEAHQATEAPLREFTRNLFANSED